MGYRLLAQGLGPEQPVYVLPYDDVFNENFERSLRDISRELVSRMRAFQPQGPYFLGGMCLAGRVAYAIAQELFEQGEEVALLALFDAPAPGYPNLSSKGAKARFLTQKDQEASVQLLAAGRRGWYLQELVALACEERPLQDRIQSFEGDGQADSADQT